VICPATWLSFPEAAIGNDTAVAGGVRIGIDPQPVARTATASTAIRLASRSLASVIFNFPSHSDNDSRQMA
jgi:hypothetical protein